MHAIIFAIMSGLIFNPLTVEQKQAFESQGFHLCLWGPGYSGKTQLGVHKGIWAAANYPGNRIFFIRKKKVDLRTSTWQRFKEILPAGLIVKMRDQDMYCQIKNGSEFFGFGLDSEEEVNKLASTESGMTITEEATEVPEVYYDEKIARSCRLPRVPFHQNITLCNPGAPAHFLNRKFIAPGHDPKYENIYMPTLPIEYIPETWLAWFRGLSGIFAERYREGKWVGAEGLVYSFDPQRHIIKRFPVPPHWRKVIAVDFGFDHPFVCGWHAVSPSDVKPDPGRSLYPDAWYLYRQIYMSHRIVEDHARDIKRYNALDGIANFAIVDHDPEDAGTLERHGVRTQPAVKDRLPGQQAVYDLIDRDRYFIFDDSLVEKDQERVVKKLPTCVQEEFPYYAWATRGKEDMVKMLDDGMDMIRYAIYTDKFRAIRGVPPAKARGSTVNLYGEAL